MGGGGQIIWSYRLFIKSWFRHGDTQKVEHILLTTLQCSNVGLCNHGLCNSHMQCLSEMAGAVSRKKGGRS
jgi:hypothetical protein